MAAIIEIRRGDTLLADFAHLGNLAAVVNIWLTVKEQFNLADNKATLQIDLVTGLLVMDEQVVEAARNANGSITITNVARGDISIRLEAEETARIDDTGRFLADLQVDDGTDIRTTHIGTARILGDVSRVT